MLFLFLNLKQRVLNSEIKEKYADGIIEHYVNIVHMEIRHDLCGIEGYWSMTVSCFQMSGDDHPHSVFKLTA